RRENEMFRLNRALLTAIAAPLLALSAVWISSAAATAAGAQVPATAAGGQPGTSSPQLVLPSPTGAYPVGRDTLHLVDASRPDPWAPRAKTRELMVSMFYPAQANTGSPAPYYSQEEAQALLDGDDVTGVPAAVLSGTLTHARANATPRPGLYPLVVL